MFVCLTPYQSGQKVEIEPQKSESIRQCCCFLHPEEKTLISRRDSPDFDFQSMRFMIPTTQPVVRGMTIYSFVNRTSGFPCA